MYYISDKISYNCYTVYRFLNFFPSFRLFINRIIMGNKVYDISDKGLCNFNTVYSLHTTKVIYIYIFIYIPLGHVSRQRLQVQRKGSHPDYLCCTFP